MLIESLKSRCVANVTLMVLALSRFNLLTVLFQHLKVDLMLSVVMSDTKPVIVIVLLSMRSFSSRLSFLRLGRFFFFFCIFFCFFVGVFIFLVRPKIVGGLENTTRPPRGASSSIGYAGKTTSFLRLAFPLRDFVLRPNLPAVDGLLGSSLSLF